MARLVFGMNQSLDGYVDHTAFAPSPTLFRHFIEEAQGQAGSVYGRQMYEVMRYWDDDHPEWDAEEHAFAAAWRNQPKWVVSRSLKSVGPNARLVEDDLEGAIRELKAERDGEIEVAGPDLAQSLTELGLIDEYRIYLHPVVLGHGKPYFAGPRPANELDPTQSLSAAAQGLAAVEANDLDRALATVQQRLARKPDDPLLLYVRADILAQKGAEPGTADFKTAVSSAQRAVALRPALAPAHGVLAKLYLQAGQTRAAIDQCRKALAIDPNDQTSVYRLIQALRKTGDRSEIPTLLKRLAQLREQAAQQERERNRYRLVEGDRTPGER